MDRERVRQREASCTAEEPPACSARCPVHVDARAMVEHVRASAFDEAFAVFTRTVPLPRVIARVCERPCEAACRRSEAGEAVAIGALERAVVTFGRPAAPRRKMPMAPKRQRVAVVGSGLSGLTAALELAAKGYPVVLYERAAALGGRLRTLGEAVLPAAELELDLAALASRGVEVRLGASERLLSLADEYDGVYAGLGAHPAPCDLDGLALEPDGRPVLDPISLASSHPSIFLGGAIRLGTGAFIASLLDGRRAATSLDRLFQKATLTAGREREGAFDTRLFTRTVGVAPAPRVAPSPGGYTREEAAAEASRCLPCRCRECLEACPYLERHGAYPKRYIRQIYNNDTIVMGNHSANRLANGCSLCGLCAVVCPEKLGMAETCLEARESMVLKGKMPPSTHEFALADMAFSEGPDFAWCEHAPGTHSSEAVFFPGCQLAASSPGHVERVYALLREQLGAVALHLGCCGAPAEWAGQRERFSHSTSATAAAWRRLGVRRVLTACPSCTRVFRAQLPGLAVEPIWNLLQAPAAAGARRRLAIHDPCAARFDTATHERVRTLLDETGIDVQEPPFTRERTSCCSQGGLMAYADPAVADAVVRQRIAEVDADFVTYCAMCRDRFAARGKRSVHLLDVLLGTPGDPAARRAPGHSQRRDARRRLKAKLLEELWHAPPVRQEPPMELVISDALASTLEQRMILHEDLARTIAAAEASGDRFIDAATGHFIASLRPAQVTFWVEYAPTGNGFTVHAAWSHRMEIDEGVSP